MLLRQQMLPNDHTSICSLSLARLCSRGKKNKKKKTDKQRAGHPERDVANGS